MHTIKRDIVCGLIFSRDGKLFQGMKDPAAGGVYADCWHIPGGGIEPGEDAQGALVREMLEETGIDISAYPIELVDDSGTGEAEKTLRETGERVLVEMKFYVYKISINDADANDITIRLSDDLVASRWTDLSELSSLKLTPPSVVLFKKLGFFSSNAGRY